LKYPIPVKKLVQEPQSIGNVTSNTQCQNNWEEDDIKLEIPNGIAAKNLEHYQSRMKDAAGIRTKIASASTLT
jgi:hypothetical protein